MVNSTETEKPQRKKRSNGALRAFLLSPPQQSKKRRRALTQKVYRHVRACNHRPMIRVASSFLDEAICLNELLLLPLIIYLRNKFLIQMRSPRNSRICTCRAIGSELRSLRASADCTTQRLRYVKRITGGSNRLNILLYRFSCFMT